MKPTIPIALSCFWVGAALILGSTLPGQASTDVTFQVDMTSQPGATDVFIKGSFNGWGSPDSPELTNNGAGIYSQTVTITDPPGTVESCKFYFNPGGSWESINNRQFILGSGTQVLPLETWNVNDWPTPTNSVTFQVDMSAQIALGNFTNGDPGSTITVSGDFEGWNDGLPLTNNPTLTGNASNVYSAVCPVVGFLPDPINYKFRMNGGWESPTSTSGNNRQATITTDGQVLPLVFYSDQSVYDLLTQPVTVTFTVYMPNHTLDKNGYAFDNTADTLWINGDFINNWNNTTWPGPVGNFPAAQQMIEVGTSDYYTNSLVVPRGNSIRLTYKYSIDSSDDENGGATNHIRDVRTYQATYAMPTDSWSWSVVQPGVQPYPNPGITATNIVEPDFGYLAIQPPVAGKYPLTWLGRPGVILESSSTVNAGWTEIPATDATQSTNWPATTGNQFFRLLKRQ